MKIKLLISIIVIFSITFMLLTPLASAQKKYTAQVAAAFDNNCDELLIANIQKAKKTILGAIYSLTNKDIVKALINRAENKVDIILKLDKEQAKFPYTITLIKMMEKAGIKIILIKMKKGDHMHHKFAVIDNKVVLTGSFNWTRNAAEDNHENIISIDSADMAVYFTDAWKKIK